MSTKKADNPISRGPVEPVLDMDDIQGIAVPGFFKPHQTLLGLRIPAGGEARCKQILAELAAEVSTAAATLKDRRNFRAERARAKVKTVHRTPGKGTVLTAIGFSHTGLVRLTPGAKDLPGEAFRQGLPERSSLLGDPTAPESEGHPSHWKIGRPGAELDILIVLAGDHRDEVTRRATHWTRRLRQASLEIPYMEEGDVREGAERGHEHFGFDDGISQPGIRGRASGRSDDFITNRHVAQEPEKFLFGYPGQDLVWPGEFILGYPSTSPDPFVPGPVQAYEPGWARNGSFLVFRRLRQDVGSFWRRMREIAQGLAGQPGFEGMDDDKLAALLVGRWRSGAPVLRTAAHDDPTLGAAVLANNHFKYDSDTEALRLADGRDTFPMAKADPAGLTCPWAAHIRKVNTRDSGSDLGGRDSTYTRRLLRVGVPFGKSLDDRYAEEDSDPEKGNRGLLFLSIQASIEDQFEFLMARWMNDASRPKNPGGNDMIVGQNAAARDGVRQCPVFGANLRKADVSTDRQWVIPTGGGYFFLPSLTALREVIAP